MRIKGLSEEAGGADVADTTILPHDKIEDLARASAKRHAHADLSSALAHDGSKHTVKSYARKERRDKSKDSDQQWRKARASLRALQLSRQLFSPNHKPSWVKRYVLGLMTARQPWLLAVFGTPSHGL